MKQELLICFFCFFEDSLLRVGCFQKYGKTTKIIHFNRVFHFGGFHPIFGNTHISSSVFGFNGHQAAEEAKKREKELAEV